MKKSVIDVNQKVIFIDTYSKNCPTVGWIVANDDKHLEMHPYIVTTEFNEKDNLSTRSLHCSAPNVFTIHKNNIIVFKEKEYKKIIKYNERISKKDTNYINIYSYNVFCLSKRIISPALYKKIRLLLKILKITKEVMRFIFNVILKGTVWLVFGNIIKLYVNQYNKYKLQNRIKEHKKSMYPSTFYYTGEGPLTHDDEVLSELNSQLDKATSEVETSSLNLITLLIALISVLISITR